MILQNNNCKIVYDSFNLNSFTDNYYKFSELGTLFDVYQNILEEINNSDLNEEENMMKLFNRRYHEWGKDSLSLDVQMFSTSFDNLISSLHGHTLYVHIILYLLQIFSTTFHT